MTATVPLDREAVQNYEMPSVTVGKFVRFYRFGRRDTRPPEIGVVLRINNRSVDLHVFGHVRMDTVRHVDDPKLKLNSDQRAMGAWDFTEDDYNRFAWVKKVDQRLAALENTMKPKAKRPAPAGKYHELRRKAISLGVSFSGNPPKNWLEQQITLKEQADGASTGEGSEPVAGED